MLSIKGRFTVSRLNLIPSLILLVAAIAHADNGSNYIDKSKCTDLAAAQEQLTNDIKKEIRDAEAKNYRPAYGYESGNIDLETRAQKQAALLAKSLIASLNKPDAPASAAAEAMFGDPTRRSTFQMYARCGSESAKPRRMIDNHRASAGCGSAQTVDVGMNVSQVFETQMSASDVMVRFARSKMRSSEKNTVGICSGSASDCDKSGAKYSEVKDASNWTPTLNKDIYTEDRTSVAIYEMVNRQVLKVRTVDVCGAKAYMVTAFGNGQTEGFKRSSVIGLIAPTSANKTVIVGDGSTFALGNSLPAKFLDYPDKAMDTIFGKIEDGRPVGGYLEIASLIGSREKTYKGMLVDDRGKKGDTYSSPYAQRTGN